MNHSFDVGYAKKYGVDEAIMISNFQYWLKKNWANEKHRHDGRVWTYNSVSAFQKLFPYWTSKQIRRIIDSLVAKGVLMRGEYNSSAYDRTAWYSFVDESTFLFENIDLPIWANQDDQKGKPIPDSKPDEEEKPSKKKVFIPPTEEEVLVYFRENGQPDFQAKKAYNFYAKFDWTDSQGKKVKNWKQKMLNNWFTDTPDQKQITPLDGDARMMALYEKGYKNCTPEELRWVFDWQHRSSGSQLAYPNNVRLVKPTSHLSKQDCIDADRAAGFN
jgi:hypothetical protein